MKKNQFSAFYALMFAFMGLFALNHSPLAYAQEAAKEDADMQNKIRAFLDQETPNLSKEFPFLLHLFENGQIAKNDAGVRISESVEQFPELAKSPTTQLSGLFFYYKLFNQAMRVPHWHANAVEMGLVLNGNMKITIWDGPGDASVFTVGKGGLWMIPQASVHVLENAGSEELDFLVSYNSAYAEDRDFSTAWAALPPKILERSLGLSASDIDALKRTTKNRLSLFDVDAIPTSKEIPSPYTTVFAAIEPLYKSSLGSIKRADETNWPAMKFMAMQQTLMKPGTIREPHWYSSSDVFFFVKKGKAFFNLMDSEGVVYNTILKEGDLVFIPIGVFHTYVNVGTEELEVYEVFTSPGPLREIDLLAASRHFRPGTLSGATGVSQDSIRKLPEAPGQVYMRSL
jgi:oxalate decarboxylase